MVVAVAEESRGAEHARPWIEQAKSSYWQLIDVEHRLSDLYNLVNVPQAVWIDEKGTIVRPPETAGSTDISGDYAAMARAFGGYGERVTKTEDIIPAIKRGIEQTQKGVPVLLEFITSKEVTISVPK